MPKINVLDDSSKVIEMLREYMSEFKRQKNIDSIDFQIDVIIIE